MRRIILLLTVIALLIPAPASAQGSRLYRLRPVSAEDYIQAIEAIKDEQYLDAQNLIHDFMRRYVTPDPTVSFAALTALFPKIYDPMITNSPELAFWNSAIISAWLKDRPIDLNKTAQFDFYIPHFPRLDESSQYHITASPRDFKGDGSYQWLLTVTVDEKYIVGIPPILDALSTNYLLATRDDHDNYHILTFPIPWILFDYGIASDPSNTILHPLFFKDLTADGVPEWVVTADPNISYLDDKAFYILTWRDGQMVNLFQNTIHNYLEGYLLRLGSMVDLVKSTIAHQTDILARSVQADNWGCQYTRTQTIRWMGSKWISANNTTTYANMAGCFWRNAESAMWQSRYSDAITNYQAGLLKMVSDTVKPDPEMLQYIQFRLALAYLLEGQPLMSSAVAMVLHSQKPASGLMQQLYDVLPRRPASDAYKVCAAAWNIFQQYQDAATMEEKSGDLNPRNFAYSNIPSGIIVGMNLDDDSGFIGNVGPFLPDSAAAGCDPALPLLERLQSQPFTTAKSLTDQLEMRGFSVSRSLSLDINHDGRSEWLVWLDVDSPPLFFAETPDGQTYHVSDAPFRGTLHVFGGMVRTLPSNNGYALIAIILNNNINSRRCPIQTSFDPTSGGYIQVPGPSNEIGALSVLRLQHGELVPMLNTPLCDGDLSAFEATYRLGEDFFDNADLTLPGSINAYLPVKNTLSPFYADNLVQVSYNWDNKTQSYLPPSSIPPLADAPSNVYDWQFVEPFDAALNRKDYPAALQIADQAMLTSCTAQCDKANAVNDHFLRATVLEMLGRNTEALAEYEFVAENAASPGQYQLAMLHLEPIDF